MCKLGGGSHQTRNKEARPKSHYWHYSHTPSWCKSSYQISIFNLSLKKISSQTGLVNTSATWSSLEQYLISVKPSGLAKVLTCFQKWWYMIAICFHLGVNFGLFNIAMQDRLSSWTFKTNLGWGRYKGDITFISLIKVYIGIVSLRACDNAMYSASAVERAISVWSLLWQKIGYPA